MPSSLVAPSLQAAARPHVAPVHSLSAPYLCLLAYTLITFTLLGGLSWFKRGLPRLGVCIPQAEPTFRAQLWRTVRTLFVAFVVLSGVGALMEERGLTKGILNNPDMRPQMEMKTRFADVKGVDEAKVCIRIVPLT